VTVPEDPGRSLRPEVTSGMRRRILFVTDAALESGTGAQRFVLRLCARARSHGFDAYVLQSNFLERHRMTKEEVFALVPEDHIFTIEYDPHRFEEVLRMPLGRLIRYGILEPLSSALASSARRGRAWFARNRFDVVYLTSNPMCRLIPPSRESVIGSSHGGLDRAIELEFVRNRLLYRRVDAFHFLSNGSAKLLRGKRPSFVLPPGIDLGGHMRGSDVSPRTLSALFVGRLIASKGVVEFLEAWRTAAANREVRAAVVGTGPLEDSVRAAERLTGAAQLVHYKTLSTLDLARVYRSSKLLVVPSKTDAFPAVVLEGIASGAYAIVSDVLRGTFDRFAENGFLEYCRPDASSLAQAIRCLLDSASAARPTDPVIRAALLREFDIDEVARRFFDAVRSLR